MEEGTKGGKGTEKGEEMREEELDPMEVLETSLGEERREEEEMDLEGGKKKEEKVKLKISSGSRSKEKGQKKNEEKEEMVLSPKKKSKVKLIITSKKSLESGQLELPKNAKIIKVGKGKKKKGKDKERKRVPITLTEKWNKWDIGEQLEQIRKDAKDKKLKLDQEMMRELEACRSEKSEEIWDEEEDEEEMEHLGDQRIKKEENFYEEEEDEDDDDSLFDGENISIARLAKREERKRLKEEMKRGSRKEKSKRRKKRRDARKNLNLEDEQEKEGVEMTALTLEAYVIEESARLPRPGMKSYWNKVGETKVEVKGEDGEEGATQVTHTKAQLEGDPPPDTASASTTPTKSWKKRESQLGDRMIYGCPYCSFSDRKHLWIEHLKQRHSSNRELVFCEYNQTCKMPFTSREAREQHVELVHKAKLSCKVCGKTFKYPCNMRYHMQQIHVKGGEEDQKAKQMYVCTYCGKKFVSKTGCRSHEAHYHTGQLNFTCNECGKAFFSKSECEIHERLHTGERPFVCTFCGQGFVSKPRLNQHERQIHTQKERVTERVQCKICGNMLSKKYISTHIKTHQGLTRQPCSICGKAFPTPSSRIRHEKIHTEDKQHECRFCGKAFVQKNNMQAHERIHTGEKPYQCKFCGEGFMQGTRRNQVRIVYFDFFAEKLKSF